MVRSDSQSPNPGEWRLLYRAAIFETDPGEMPNRIADAEAAAVKRFREISRDARLEADEERETLDDAIYALRAWKTALQNKTRVA